MLDYSPQPQQIVSQALKGLNYEPWTFIHMDRSNKIKTLFKRPVTNTEHFFMLAGSQFFLKHKEIINY